MIGSPKQMFLIKIEQQGNDEEVQNNMIIGVKETLKKDIGEISFFTNGKCRIKRSLMSLLKKRYWQFV